MREVYRGNGFIVTTNDCGEIFVALENSPTNGLRISSRPAMMTTVSYMNTNLEMFPSGAKQMTFKHVAP